MKKIDFDNDSIKKNILQAALPMMAAQILSLLYNIVAVSYTHLYVYKRQSDYIIGLLTALWLHFLYSVYIRHFNFPAVDW